MGMCHRNVFTSRQITFRFRAVLPALTLTATFFATGCQGGNGAAKFIAVNHGWSDSSGVSNPTNPKRFNGEVPTCAQTSIVPATSWGREGRGR
jgi:hypothetical protein